MYPNPHHFVNYHIFPSFLAPKGLTNFALQKQAASGLPLAKKKCYGLLSSWLAQRVQLQGQ
jgi:hypothetical protein